MKKIIDEIIPAQAERKVKKTFYYCDLCGEEIENPMNDYDKEQGIIFYNEYYYNWGSDGGEVDNYVFDLCNECIKNKVFPLIEKHLKIKPRYDEESW